jgi:hypothetical protein
MGLIRYSLSAHEDAVRAYVPSSGPSTRRGAQHVRDTGKLNPLVDPAGFNVIRRSLLRFVERTDGLFTVSVGTSVPVEVRLDTTGSMGRNVDIAIQVLPDTYGLTSGLLPDCDLHVAIGIFGDVVDRFVLCRPQFEMLAEKIVDQLTLMVPEGNGGDADEDPQYGLFGAAYLTAAYINRIGLKGYDFTISDACGRDYLEHRTLKRVFGDEVFEKAADNGFQIDPNNLPSTKEVVDDLLKRAHAFFLQVDSNRRTTNFWTELFGPERVIILPDVHLLPQVQATIIGLTEGTLALSEVLGFLEKNGVTHERDREAILRSVSNIPIGAQAALPNFDKKPQAGDVFRTKEDLWPMDPSEVPDLADTTDGDGASEPDAGPNWL